MKNYLRWAFRQLFLLYFQPTRFRREIEAEAEGKTETALGRLWFTSAYFSKLTPILLFVTFGINTLVGILVELAGYEFLWKVSLTIVILTVAFGVVGGVAFGVVGGVAFGVAYGVAFSVVGGVAFGVAFGVAYGVAFGVATGVAYGVAYGVAAGVAGSVGVGVAGGVGVGVGVGVVGGVTGGVVGGVAAGVAAGVAYGVGFFRFVNYLVNIPFFIAGFIFARLRHSLAFDLWKLSPVYWDEVIWLPIPFVSKFLVLLTKLNREEGFNQIIFVAAERPLQKRAALAALAEITAKDLFLKNLNDISRYQSGATTLRLERVKNVSFHGGTNSTPAMAAVGIEGQLYPAELLAPEFNEPLPRFDRVAAQVGQFYELRNSFRKGEALDRALGELESLQKSLVLVRGKYIPRLLQAANQWRDIIRAERDSLATAAEQSQEIPNPFVYGNPVTENDYNVFAGRVDVVAKIESEILNARQAPTLLLFGPRRMGKSSILNQLPRLLGPDFAIAMVDCQAPEVREGVAKFLEYVAKAIAEGVKRRRIPVEPLSVSALEKSPFSAFTDWLAKLEAILPEGTRILLCLDEYERLQATLDAGWGADLLDFLRNTIQHRAKFVVMFTGANKVSELGPAWTDRFISVRSVRVSFLGREEITPLFTTPIPEFDMTYAEGALDAVLTQTKGQPFLSQALGFELVQYLNEQSRKQATVVDVEVAVGRVIENADAYFANVWSDAREDGQEILRAVAAGTPVPDHPRAMRWLKEHDVLNGDGKFHVPMVERWVRERA